MERGFIAAVVLLARVSLISSQCTPPPPGDCFIEHADPATQVYPVRASAPYSCTLPGYHVEGEDNTVTVAMVRCARRGWREVPTCVPVDCGAPPDGTGTVEVPDTTSIMYEQTYVYSCLPGYSPAVPGQNMVVTCTADGTFFPTDPIVCNVVNCGPIPTIPGIKDIPPGTTLSYPDTYTYECLDGYTTEDEVCTQCLADGTYSITPPTCTEVTCGQPGAGTGTVPVPPAMDLKWEESYTYECMDGYTTTDLLCTVCRSDGSLSLDGNEPVCTEVTCGQPGAGTGTVPVPPATELKWEQSYTYECMDGYTTTDPLCTVCRSDGSLSLDGNEPICTEVMCGQPADGAGTVPVPLATNLKWEDSYTYECMDGYTTTDPLCTVCLSDGSLSLDGSEPVCTAIVCGIPPAGVNTVTPTDALSYLEVYQYECLPGYTTTDNLITLCTPDGVLSSPPPDCIRDISVDICGTPEDGNFTVEVPNIVLYTFDIYNYQCIEGYYTTDETCVVCYPNGTLSSGPPTCYPIICDAPANGTNTKPVPACLETGMVYLDIYQYECMEGYVTDDELCQVCLPDGTLSLDTPPVCYVDGCQTPPDGTNTASPVIQNYAVGEVYQYECLPGYVFFGVFYDNSETECLPNKEWSLLPPPVCTRECVDLPGVLHRGIVPNTGCQDYYVNLILNPYDPAVVSCPAGELFDIDTCDCATVPITCAVP